MAFQSAPTWMENSADHHADVYRTMLASLVVTSGVTAGGLAVSEKSGTPNMSIDVGSGGVFVLSTRSPAEGVYHGYNDATINVPLSAASASNPRRDRILVQVRDEAQDAALTQNDIRILVVQGTPAASPSLPAITVADYYELAQVLVAASATSITNAAITNTRSKFLTAGPAGRVNSLASSGASSALSSTGLTRTSPGTAVTITNRDSVARWYRADVIAMFGMAGGSNGLYRPAVTDGASSSLSVSRGQVLTTVTGGGGQVGGPATHVLSVAAGASVTVAAGGLRVSGGSATDVITDGQITVEDLGRA